jgi:UDP-glucose 4-epimerase
MDGGTIEYHEKRHEVHYAVPTFQKSIDLLNFNHKTDLKSGLIQMWDWAKNVPMKERFIWDRYEIEKGIYSFWKNK